MKLLSIIIFKSAAINLYPGPINYGGTASSYNIAIQSYFFNDVKKSVRNPAGKAKILFHIKKCF